MEKPQKILFYCQHSLGIGHLVRSFRIIASLVQAFEVTLLSGGAYPKGLLTPKGFRFVQLPAISVGEDGNLQAMTEKEAIAIVMKKRRAIVMETYKKCQPDILITEYFPFGKFQFMGELLPLLRLSKAAKKKVSIISSLRDILEPTSINQKMLKDLSVSIVNQYYDCLLIHGDPNVVPIEETYPEIAALKIPITYTGYVTKEKKTIEFSSNQAAKKVLLSIGGGKVGSEMVFKIVEAFQAHGFGVGVGLKVITGPHFPASEWEKLKTLSLQIPSLEIIQFVNNLVDEWKQACLSISMGGYNTLLELINHKIPALVMPFENERNKEQLIRAQKFEQLGLLKILQVNGLTSFELAKKIQSNLTIKPSNFCIAVDGALKTMEFLLALKKN